MLLALALIATSQAVPKVFSDTVVLVAVAPDGHHVLLATLGSFDERPHDLVERDVATGAARPAGPEVEAAFASCTFDAPCPPLDDAWRPGAWIAWSDPPVPARWIVTASGTDGWSTFLAESCTNEGTIFTPCRAARGLDIVDLRARDGEVRVTLEVGQRERVVRFSPRRLAQRGVPANPFGGVVVWGADGVLVAFPGEWAAEGEARAPLMAFVLPTR